MNKWFYRFASVLIIILLLAGCGADEQSQEEGVQNGQGQTSEQTEGEAQKKEELVTITISLNNGKEYIDEKQVEVEEGATLMEVMKANFEIETAHGGGFITSIAGVAPKEGEKKAWLFTVNGEMAKVGAKELELSPGDKVVFDLHAY